MTCKELCHGILGWFLEKLNNFSGLTFGPKGMIIQESLGILPVNAFLTHPIKMHRYPNPPI